MPEVIPSLYKVEREANRRYSPLSEGKFIFDKLLVHLEGYNAERWFQSQQELYPVWNMIAAATKLLILCSVLPCSLVFSLALPNRPQS